MSRSCLTCASPQVQAINALLAAGRSARSLAAEFGLPPESLKRHARNHGVAPATPEQSTDPLDELVAALRERALGSQNSSFAREYRLAISALSERNAAPPAYDVLRDADWLRLREAMLTALRPYPDAREAIADALRQFE